MSLTTCPAHAEARAIIALAVAAVWAPFWVSPAHAQSAPAQPASSTLPVVVVSATRTEASSFDVPASIDAVYGDAYRDGRPGVNISEGLSGVAGLQARDRQNYAQDVQISVRGFGARSTFGIRGVRIYVDGVPATMPDGQGQISNVDLNSVDRIEILRGPFSSLYGNSSGGVLNVFSEEGSGPLTITGGFAVGSDKVRRESLKASGAALGLGYVVSGSHFETDGYRDHSVARRDLGNVKLTVAPDANSKLTFVANTVSLPRADDPLGLSRAQFNANPRGVDPGAIQFNTRKTVDQTQGGAVYERKLDVDNSFRVMAYTGDRSTTQYQSIPVATQGSALHPGGVIDLSRNYDGVDARWTHKGVVSELPYTLVAGLDYDQLDETRKGYQNFVGSTLGVQGALRRNEDNKVHNADEYLQASVTLNPQLSAFVGVRHSQVKFESADHYIVGTNPNDSGSVDYHATLPVVGLMFAESADFHWYLTAGRGFETPTLNELAYRPSGLTGMNFALQPATSNNFEIGVKSRLGEWGEVDAALFQTRTRSEIVTLTNTGGRSTFQNAGTTRRNGLEVAWNTHLAGNLQGQVAYTWIDATYQSSFRTCTATPCGTPNVTIPSGNRIPGIARSSLYGALAYAPVSGWRASIDARLMSKVYVNDLNNDAASNYFTLGASTGYVMRLGSWNLSGYARGDNLNNRKYAGSVIVNEGNQRYFEPAPGRTWTAGLTAAIGF
jgi:iron complex outermembrane receptor protein